MTSVLKTIVAFGLVVSGEQIVQRHGDKIDDLAAPLFEDHRPDKGIQAIPADQARPLPPGIERAGR